jgi:amidophosphoribosyltransferase
MGGFCGVIAKDDCVSDLFFGTDYHSHLGTHRGGMCVLGEKGFQRSIHNIQNSPFRSKFERDVGELSGHIGLGVISDTDPQPLVMRCAHGTFALVTVGLITNIEDLMKEMFEENHLQLQYSTTSGMVGPTEVVSAILASAPTLEEGVRLVQQKVQGSCSFMLITETGRFFAVRDRYGRTPIVIGRREGAMIALQESCALANLGYEYVRDLGPGEMAELTVAGDRTVIEPGKEMAICSFLWVYYGYPASSYEGRNVEMSRYRSGAFLARRNPVEADSVGGVPDSGISHALGYAHEAGLKYARPFVKYTPSWARSFLDFCQARVAAAVAGPKMPSAFAPAIVCHTLTAWPWLPCFKTGSSAVTLTHSRRLTAAMARQSSFVP